MYKVMAKFVSHWSSLQGAKTSIDKDALREIFNKIDKDGNEKITLKEYKACLGVQPNLFSWFDIFNEKI